MSKKRFLSIVISAVMILSLACSALAVGQSGRYIGNSTVNGSIYQTYYQVDAQTRTGIKSISVSGTLYEKGTFGTWQRVSNCSNTSTTSNCMASGNYNTKPGKSYKLEYAHTTITIRPGVNVSLTYKKAEGIITFEPRVTQSVMAKGDHTFRYNAQGDIVA